MPACYNFAALLAVLGTTLTETFIVSTRSTGMIAAGICQECGVSSLTIDILEEIRGPSNVPRISHDQHRTVEGSANYIGSNYSVTSDKSLDKSTNVTRTTTTIVVPLIDCVTLPNAAALPAVNKRLRNWNFYDGIGHEVRLSRAKILNSVSLKYILFSAGYAVYK